MLENILYFVLSCFVLIVSGTFLVKSLSKISRFLRISEFSAAFIIMAIATSLPELFVGISSAASKNPSLSLGNVIGASIIDLTLVAGIIILFSREIRIRAKRMDKDAYFMLVAILLVIILYIIGKSLSRIDGIILLFFFTFNIIRKLKKSKKYKKRLEGKIKRWNVILNTFVFIFALVFLFLSASQAVKYASALAIDLSLPKIIIGLFLLSFATTLPELVFGISATSSKHKEMSLGDLMGGVVTNFTLVLGIVSVLSPIQADFLPFLTSAIFLFIFAFIFVTFLKTGGKLERIEGVSLILIYVLFVIIEFFIK